MKTCRMQMGDIATIIDGDRGSNYPKQNEFFDKGFCLFLNAGNVTSEGFVFENNSYISAEKDKALRKGKLKRGDIVYTTRGTIGNVAYYKSTVPFENIRINSGMVIIRVNEELIDAEYLYQYLKSTSAREYFLSFKTGSAQPQLPIKNFSRIQICVPDLISQKRIASILSAYDDLIENNRRQIKLLEEAAQRLYREWFVELRFPGHEDVKIVDGVPEGWNVMAMNDIAEYINGYAFKPSDWGSKGKPIIKIKEMGSGVTADTPRNSGEGIPEKYIVTSGDILFSWSATLSAVIWDQEDGLLNQHLFKVVPSGNIAREFAFQSILHTLDEFSNLTTGSTMKHIQRGKLNEVFLNVPDYGIMKKYESVSYPMREEILILGKRMTLLREARDRLLPKLMSGEVEV